MKGKERHRTNLFWATGQRSLPPLDLPGTSRLSPPPSVMEDPAPVSRKGPGAHRQRTRAWTSWPCSLTETWPTPDRYSQIGDPRQHSNLTDGNTWLTEWLLSSFRWLLRSLQILHALRLRAPNSSQTLNGGMYCDDYCQFSSAHLFTQPRSVGAVTDKPLDSCWVSTVSF